MQLTALLRKYRLKLGFTLLLIVTEALLSLLFPLFIGYAVDNAIQGSYAGAIQLGLLGLATLVIGVGRRVFDSRLYAKVYTDVGTTVLSATPKDSSSVKSARLGMLRELVEFLENTLPELIGTVIGLIGVVALLATLNLTVFYGSLAVTGIIFLIYAVTSRKTVRFNRASNDEFEKQVEVISSNHESELRTHLQRMMKWNIRLSDLEAVNFSLSWFVLLSFLVASIVVSITSGIVTYGALFALIMYVFHYLENVVNLPFFYQNGLRLREIWGRLMVSR